MEFEKKLIVLTGKEGKGTALIERNGMGVFLLLNLFSLPDLTVGEYAVGVKTGRSVFSRYLGSLGRIRTRIKLPDADYAAVHLVVFNADSEQVVLYGTAAKQRMWDGNLMDGLRRKKNDEKALGANSAGAPPQEFSYSERKIEDYFLDILPGGQYADGAVAQTNYFAFSGREEASAREEEVRVLPSEAERAYLAARFPTEKETDELLSDTARMAATLQEMNEGGGALLDEAADAAAGAEQEAQKIKTAKAYTVEAAVASAKTHADFYARVKPQIDRLFKSGQPFAALEARLPNTKWVRVDYDGRRYYLVGLIGEAPDYLAYGVPGAYATCPLAGADFIPEKEDAPTGKGYWVLFQSARTGEEIKERK